MTDIILLFFLLWLYMTVWFGIAYATKRNDVADVAWGLGFPFMGWSAFVLADNHTTIAMITNFLITIWGLRLSWYIALRNSKKTEDYRYAEWRRTWNNFVLRSYLQIFLLQGVLLFIIALPFMLLNLSSNTSEYAVATIGVALWVIGFIFEAVGDKQLANFMSIPSNKGKIMQTGLWRYTRHPNYFGEATMWWGIFTIAISTIDVWPAIISPMVLTYLLLFVSGVPMLERKYAGNKEYEHYKKKTSMFIPLLPKKI